MYSAAGVIAAVSQIIMCKPNHNGWSTILIVLRLVMHDLPSIKFGVRCVYVRIYFNCIHLISGMTRLSCPDLNFVIPAVHRTTSPIYQLSRYIPQTSAKYKNPSARIRLHLLLVFYCQASSKFNIYANSTAYSNVICPFTNTF